MIRILLQCFAVTALAVGLIGCSDSKARSRVAAMDTEALEHLSTQYPPDSKAARLIAQELSRRPRKPAPHPPVESKQVVPATDLTPTKSRVIAPPTPRGLGLGDRQILSSLEEYFPRVEESTPVHGRPRRMGQTSDNLAYVEIIGDPNDVHSASVMIGIPNDAPAILIRNTVICLILLKNALPTWDDRADWFNSSLERINDSPEKTSEETTVGNARVKLILVKQLGMCTLSVTAEE